MSCSVVWYREVRAAAETKLSGLDNSAVCELISAVRWCRCGATLEATGYGSYLYCSSVSIIQSAEILNSRWNAKRAPIALNTMGFKPDLQPGWEVENVARTDQFVTCTSRGQSLCVRRLHLAARQ